MNVPAFIALLKQSGNTTGEYLHSLKKITETYPYFQAARALYLKTLKQQEHFEYNTALKHTAAFTTDRSILFDFITSETFVQHQTATHINARSSDVNSIKVTAEEFIFEPFDKAESEAVLNPELFQPKPEEAEEISPQKATPEEKTPEEQLQIGTPLPFNPDEFHSFTVWLQLSSPTPVKRATPEKHVSETQKKQDEKFKLIDKFIAQNPKIIPKKEIEASRNIIVAKDIEKADLMTETLARVYLEQKKFKKAIQAYRILSLKYPEKSGFFADQIKTIKKLQQNNK